MTSVEAQGAVGLLAGEGLLPVEFARRAARRGLRVVVVAVTPDTHPDLDQHATRIERIPVTQWARVVAILQAASIEEVFVLGKVPKALLFSEIPMDARFKAIVGNAPDARDDQLLRAFAADLDALGIRLGNQTSLMPELFPGPGVLTRRAPSGAETADIAFGFHLAKGIAGYDIGQTVIVKEKAVLAVEAIEGTDEAVRRGGRLGRGGAVAVKVSKPQQDLRFDVPTIGPRTIEAMIETGVDVLAFEAHRTFVVAREEMIDLADRQRLCVVGCDLGTEPAREHTACES